MCTKTAVIFGVTGQDGAFLSRLLLEKNYRVIGVARRSSCDNKTRLNQFKILDNKNFTLLDGDITDYRSVHQVFKTAQDLNLKLNTNIEPIEIYNLAAMSDVGISFNQPEVCFDVNTKGVLNILQEMTLCPTLYKFYQAGTSEQFGSSVDNDGFQRETTPFHPRSPYAVSKVAAHHLVQNYREAYGLHSSVGVLFNHESIPHYSPIIVRGTDGQIDILPIGDIFGTEKHRWEGLLKKYNGYEVWDGAEWTKIIAGTAYQDIKKKTVFVETRNGCCEATIGHVFFKDDNAEIPCEDLKIGDKLFETHFPKSNYNLINDLNFAKFLGFVVGDGYVAENGDITLTGNNLEEIIAISRLVCDKFGWSYHLYKDECTNKFGTYKKYKPVYQLNIRNDKLFGQWIRKMIYTKKKEKKVPKYILNSNTESKKAFFDGYYIADGRKRGNETYQYKGFTTKSATLCLGLNFIFSEISTQSPKVRCDFRQNDGCKTENRLYYYCQYNCGYETNKGKHRIKDKNEIISLKEWKSDDGWYFDIQTENKRFASGASLCRIHNSELRGTNFLTRKVSKYVGDFYKELNWCDITKDLYEPPYNKEIVMQNKQKLLLGNLNSSRDWGYAGDYCIDYNVPLLTPNGWKFRKELKIGDKIINFNTTTDALEIDSLIDIYDTTSNGDRYHFSGQGVDFSCTENHRLYYQQKSCNSKGGWSDWKVATAKEIFDKLNNTKLRSRYNYRFPTFKNNNLNEFDIRDEKIYLLGALLAEGSLDSIYGNGIRVSLSQSYIVNEKIHSKIQDVINKLNLDARISNNNNGVTEWVFSTESSKEILSWFEFSNVHICPKYVYSFSQRQSRILFDALMDCDGCWGNMNYSSKRYLLATDFQSIAHLAGFRTSQIGKNADNYVVQVICKNKPYIYIQKADYTNNNTDKVWCVNTNNGTIITRDNNCLFISGNCKAMYLILQQDKPDDYVIATGETHSVQEFVAEAFKCIGIKDFQPYIDISLSLIRPSEVDFLKGDSSKAREKLGWKPEVKFNELVRKMVSYDAGF